MADHPTRGRQLYDFQREGVVRLTYAKSLLLADDMGLGKTVQALVAMECLFRAGAVQRVLIVCPASLLANWKRETSKWAPSRPAAFYRGSDRSGLLESNIPVLISSFETITKDWRRPSIDGERFFPTEIDLMIIDEAQRIKNPDAACARVLSRALVPRRWALTGTPVENRPEDLASILRFLEPNEFPDIQSLSDYAKILELRDRLMLRRSKDDVLSELPPKTVAYVPVEMTPAQRSDYERELRSVREELKGLPGDTPAQRRRMTLLGGIQRLRKLSVISADGAESGKLEFLDAELEKLAAAGEKAVVFSTFANEVLPHASRRFKRHGAVLYRGEMSLAEREAASSRFLHDCHSAVMLASLRAAGVGLSWSVARHVYHLDLWWNPQALTQADDRVHRIGQVAPVIVKRLFSVDSIEEGILDLLERKEQIFELVVTGAEAPSPLPGATEAELYSLLGVG